MKSVKNVFVATALSAAMVMPAFASESPSMAAPLPQFSAADARLIFETDAKPMQLAVLSQQEMMKTEGANAPLVAIGVMTGNRFIVQRYVTQRVARKWYAGEPRM